LTRHYFPHMRNLTLTTIQYRYLSEFGRNCPNLRRLSINLDFKQLLQESELHLILSNFNKLRELELWCCDSISLGTIEKILTEYCPLLKKLLISTADMQNDASPLTGDEFKSLTDNFPHVQFKIWHHSIYGNRHFRYHRGRPSKNHNLIPKQTNTFSLKTSVIEENGQSQIIPVVLIDNIPIWSNETAASLSHLLKTTTDECGALPMISDWCCECNIHNYNGVLFYHDGEQLIWETHEPGIKQVFPFSKEQYTKAINDLLDSTMVDV